MKHDDSKKRRDRAMQDLVDYIKKINGILGNKAISEAKKCNRECDKSIKLAGDINDALNGEK